MKFIVITGLSGAGKSHALKTFEDLGFYCVDNMPISLIPKFAELAIATKGQYENVALVTDVRAGHGAEELFTLLGGILDAIDYKVVFLEASTDVLIKRYKETRRKHPLSGMDNTIVDAIYLEREQMDVIRNRADYVIDTTALSTAKLREYLISLFVEKETRSPIVISMLSFGFKYGIPTEADLVFDVRFLPNPYYENDLRHKNGLSADVRDFVFQSDDSAMLLHKLYDLLDFLIPRYIAEGKNSLVIAIGCTGGKHRSVAISEAVAAYLREHNYLTTITHRDIERSRH